MCILVLYIEVLRFSLAVMSCDKVFYLIRKVVLLGQFCTLCYMADNHLGAVNVLHLLMGIHARLVLSEINRVSDFTYVVIKSACTNQLTLGSNLVCYLCSQITNLYRVLECAWCNFTHLAEQFFVHVRQLDKRDV